MMNRAIVARRVDGAKGISVEICHDEYLDENPMRDWDWLGHISLVGKYKGYGTQDDYDLDVEDDSYRGDRTKLRAIRIFGGVVIPVYCCDHSGVCFSAESFGDPWDSGVAGYAWMDKDTVEREFGGNKEKARESLREMIRVMGAYAEGEVYGVQLYEGEDVVDGCGGFFMTDGWHDMISSMSEYVRDDFKKLILACKYGEVESRE